MNMKYYNQASGYSGIYRQEPKPYSPYSHRAEVIVPEQPAEAEPTVRTDTPADQALPMQNTIARAEAPSKETSSALLGGFQPDDLLLLGLIMVLLMNKSDDYLLLIVLGYLFLSGL